MYVASQKNLERENLKLATNTDALISKLADGLIANTSAIQTTNTDTDTNNYS